MIVVVPQPARVALDGLRRWNETPPVCPFCQQALPRDGGEAYHMQQCYIPVSVKLAAATDAEIASSRQPSASPTAPPEKTRDRALAAMRSLVSQKKVRFQQDGFDLDLTYITPKIIAMGFPSAGREAYYRNPIDEVERFFEQRHKGHYRIYNLCSEREYDDPNRFGGRYHRVPFDDHNAPSSIKLIPDLCRDAAQFLQEDERNVTAIHCKAGKGRTGLMVSCLLMMLDPALRTPDAALQFFGEVRTLDGKGVTIPSQKRYVGYWDVLLRDYQGREPPPRSLIVDRIRINTLVRTSGQCEVYFHVLEKGRLKFESKKVFPSSKTLVKNDGIEFDFPTQPPLLTLSGDVKFVFFQQNRVLKDEEIFEFWLNTALCQETEVLPKAQLDKACKDKKHTELCAELSVTLTFKPVQTAPGSAKDDPQKNKSLLGRLFK